MSTTPSKNGRGKKKPQLNSIQKLRWQNTFDLLRNRSNASEEEASEFAYRKVAVAEEIERELAHA